LDFIGVRISTTKVMTMMEMEQHIKGRYDFAMSAFARMYGVNYVMSSPDFLDFVRSGLKLRGKNHSSGTISEINFYFLDLWKIWGGYV